VEECGDFGVEVYDIEFDTSIAVYVGEGAKCELFRCKLDEIIWLTNGIAYLDYCYITDTDNHVVRLGAQSYARLYGCKVYIGAQNFRGANCTESSIFYPSKGTVIDAASTTGTTGIHVDTNGIAQCWQAAADGYNRIRNCNIGVAAEIGGKAIYTANHQYSGNNTDESATAASYGYID